MKWVWISNQPNYRHTLERLIGVTEELVRNHVRKSAWIAMAGAQQVNANHKVESCIAVGMHKYWHGLAAGTYFANRRLDACIGVIRQDIVGIWNFQDDNEILHRPSFKNAVLLLVQDLADPNGPSPGSDITKNLEAIKAVLDVATPISGLIVPVVASVGVSVMFAKWLSDMYSSTPGVLRCLMGYIVDITIVLEVLFWLKIAQPTLPTLCEDDIIAAFEHYQGSTDHLEVHQSIRRYVDNMTLIDHLNPKDNTHIEVKKLINSHRHTLIDTILTGPKNDAKTTAAPPAQHLDDLQTPKTDSSSAPSASAGQSGQKHIGNESEGSTVTPAKKANKSGFFSFLGKKLRRKPR